MNFNRSFPVVFVLKLQSPVVLYLLLQNYKMEETIVYLKWYKTFLFLFQAILTVADTTTDILTCLEYREKGELKWFAVSLGVTVVTLIVLCVWSVIVSTLRTLTTEEDDADAEDSNPDVIFRSPVVNVLLSCFCVGPPLHSFQMFLICAFRFKELWKSERGLRVEKGRLYYLYIHTLNLKMVEGLLEAAPQLIIQLYVMRMNYVEDKPISLIQKISVPISFLSLTWMITSMELFREFANSNTKLLHNLVIFISNVGIIAARTLAVLFFTLAFPWWLSLMFCTHIFLVNACGYVLWRSERKQDIVTFIFAYSPLYLLIYSSYHLNKLRGSAPFRGPLKLGVSVAWHLLFTAENIFMIVASYRIVDERKWFDTLVLSVVLVGNFGGILLKWVSWFYCFEKESGGHYQAQGRPVTIKVANTMNRRL